MKSTKSSWAKAGLTNNSVHQLKPHHDHPRGVQCVQPCPTCLTLLNEGLVSPALRSPTTANQLFRNVNDQPPLGRFKLGAARTCATVPFVGCGLFSYVRYIW